MSRYQHGYFLPSLATPPYRPLFLAGLPGYIQYLRRAAVCMFEPLLVPVKGSQEYITYELVPTSPAVSRMSGSSYFDSFRNGW